MIMMITGEAWQYCQAAERARGKIFVDKINIDKKVIEWSKKRWKCNFPVILGNNDRTTKQPSDKGREEGSSGSYTSN